MSIPVRYNLRNLVERKVSTAMTVGVVALVVAVVLCLMAMVEGIRRTLSASVSARNVIALRVGAQSEVESYVSPEQIETMRTFSGIARDEKGDLLVSPELVVLVNVPKRDGTKTNLQVRGVTPMSFEMRPAIKLVEGKLPEPGTDEAVVSRSVARRFANCQLGGILKAGAEQWRIVGILDASDTPFDSEVWVDFHNLQGQIHRPPGASAVMLRAADAAAARSLREQIQNDQRVKLQGKSEKAYYAEQMVTGKPIEILAYLVAVIMAVGASFGAMNTMYAQVAARTREIGTMRALGFPRRTILASFLAESVFLGALGGVLGAFLALGVIRTILSGPIGTNNFRTFSDILFNFELTPALMAGGVAFSLAMGLFGGFFPAFRAARLKIVSALREV
jgi:putative ABC transport system permease protein